MRAHLDQFPGFKASELNVTISRAQRQDRVIHVGADSYQVARRLLALYRPHQLGHLCEREERGATY